MKHHWTYFFWSFLGIFLLLLSISFSFGYHIIPDVSALFTPLFEGLAELTGRHIFAWDNYTTEISSDSRSFYANFFNLLILSSIFASLSVRLLTEKLDLKKLQYWVSRAVACYLALQLISYGFNKVFKWQFYMAEPNTLYTPMGQLHKDILYWSVMGASYTYTVFAGAIEVLAGGLLLFRKTRFFGALLAFGIMLNVWMINLGFNISVKLYSFVLMVFALSLILPRLKDFWAFAQGKATVAKEEWSPQFKIKWLKPALKIGVISLIFIEGLWPYVSTGNYNDDLAERPRYHGAYEVDSFRVEGEEVSLEEGQAYRWRRFFVHRRGYFIIQSMNDEMIDYMLEVDPERQVFQLEDYEGNTFQLNYHLSKDSIMSLSGEVYNRHIAISARQLNWRALPLVKPEFHITVDEINPQ